MASNSLKLIVMRHAEAVPDTGGDDHARVLTKKGFAQARMASVSLQAAGHLPDVIIASDSARTRETAQGLAEVWNKSGAVAAATWSRRLYLGGLAAIEELGKNLDAEKTRTLLVLGHNPGFSEAAGLLSGRAVNLSPGAAAVLTIDAESWAEAMAFARGWQLCQVVQP